MALRECKVCKSLYDDETYIGTTEICHNCRMRLEGTYGRIYNYIRDRGEINVHDLARLAEETGTTPAEMEIIIDLGWLERDIQTYSTTISDRQKLAKEFAAELKKMIEEHKKIRTYDGANRRYKIRRSRKK